ncbi:hypothetical protein K488DRAFT_88614 [Vararia minispora EC-137]|uniref:Uncharacterized protein n=1 Tax=Vararia minispora EC-137 TaxID=1314806 RepID=A0ACB8QD95_9AGAM|nr:hypothetical protein K488DRAFT_88614 [Vararia minispora EC-137]
MAHNTIVAVAIVLPVLAAAVVIGSLIYLSVRSRRRDHYSSGKRIASDPEFKARLEVEYKASTLRRAPYTHKPAGDGRPLSDWARHNEAVSRDNNRVFLAEVAGYPTVVEKPLPTVPSATYALPSGRGEVYRPTRTSTSASKQSEHDGLPPLKPNRPPTLDVNALVYDLTKRPAIRVDDSFLPRLKK